MPETVTCAECAIRGFVCQPNANSLDFRLPVEGSPASFLRPPPSKRGKHDNFFLFSNAKGRAEHWFCGAEKVSSADSEEPAYVL